MVQNVQYIVRLMEKGGELMKANIVLKSYVVRANLTQNELAKCIGMSRTALSKRLTGKIKFAQDEMQAIQNVLNSRLGLRLTIDELFFS